MTKKIESKGVGDRTMVIREDPHVIEQVERLYPAYLILEGATRAASLDECVAQVAFGIAGLEANPDIVRMHGHLVVERTMHGYMVMLRTPEIQPLKMTPYGPARDRFAPVKTGAWIARES